MSGNFAVEGPASVVGGAFGLAGLCVLGVALYGFYAWPWIAGLAAGYVVLCCFVGKPETENALTKVGLVALVISAVAAVLLSIPVGLLVVTFKLAASIIIGLFTIAIVCYGLGGSRLMFLFLIPSVVLASAILFLHPPPGTIEDHRDSPDRTKIIIKVVDDEDRMSIGGADVYVSWHQEGALDSNENKEHVGQTDLTGTVVYRTWTNPEQKVAVITSTDSKREWFGYWADGHFEAHHIRKGETREVEVSMRSVSTR